MIPKKWKIKFENKIIDYLIFRQSLVAFHPILYIILQKSKKFLCMSKFSEFWAFGVLTFRNLEPSIPSPLIIFGCRLTDHSDFYAVGEYNFYAFSNRHSQFWICFFIIIDWLINWLLRQWDFRISISLINDIWIVLSLKIPRSVFFLFWKFFFFSFTVSQITISGHKVFYFWYIGK